MKNMNSENRRRLRLGGYSALLILIAIAAAVVINILVGKIPTNYTNLDLTSASLYSLSDQTKEIVSGLDEDVTVYLIAETGAENAAITELLGKYEGLSGRLKVKYVDPNVQPGFVKKYTDTEISLNSIVVESDKRYKLIPYEDIVVTSYTYNQNTGGYAAENTFDGENRITSAVDYVVSDTLPTLYTITNHGEAALSDSMLKKLEDQNIDVAELNTLTVESIPEDATCVLINSPLTDYTENDIRMLEDYMKSGGNLMLTTFYLEEGRPNLEKFMAEYGLSLVDGVIMEGDSGHTYYGYPHYLIPEYGSHEITAPLSAAGYAVLYPTAQGIETAETYRDSLKITPLLMTTDTAYSKVDVANMQTYDFEEGDIQGGFDIAVAVEDGKYNGRIVWFTSYVFSTDDADTLVSGANYDLLVNAFGWTCEHESSISIHGKDLAVEYLNINTADGRSLTVFFMAVLPIAAVIAGAVVIYKRKKH